MTARILLLCVALLTVAAGASAELALQPVGRVVTPPPIAWGNWGETTLAVTDLDARLVTWSNSELARTRTLFDLPAPPELVDAWGDSVLIQVPGEGGRLLARGGNDPTVWIETPSNWRLANTEIDGVGYRILVDPAVFLLVYSAPGPGGIVGLLDIAQSIGEAVVWAWDGDRALLGNEDGAYVVNLSNPLVPFISDTIEPPVAGWVPRALAVHGRTGYVHWGDRIAIYDITGPGESPQLNQFLNDDQSFAVNDHWLVSWGTAGEQSYDLTIVDVSDPSQISTRGTATAPADLAEAEVALNGDRLEVLHPLGLAAYEIPAGMAPPRDLGVAWPVLEGPLLATAGQTAWLQGTDRRYVADLASGAVVNVQGRPSEASPYSMPVRDDILYYSLGAGLGVHIESLADPRDPQPLTVLDPVQGLEGIDVAGDLLAAADGTGVVIYDVSDPAAPVRRGELALDGACREVCLVDDTVVVVARREFNPDLLHVVDITDRDAPQLTGSFVLEPAGYPNRGQWAWNLVRRDQRVHVLLTGTSMSGLPLTDTATVDLADPANPTLAFVADDVDFWCYEEFNPGGFGDEFIATLDVPVTIGDYHVSFRADTVAVYTDGGGVDQLDRVASWIAPDPVETIAAAGNKLLVFANHRLDVLTLTDLDIVDVPDVASVAAVQAVPNPFNPQTEIVFDMPRPGTALVEIYDLRGGQLRRIEATLPAGPGRLTWRGDDQAGRAVPSGSYLLRVRTPDGVLKGRCQLIR